MTKELYWFDISWVKNMNGCKLFVEDTCCLRPIHRCVTAGGAPCGANRAPHRDVFLMESTHSSKIVLFSFCLSVPASSSHLPKSRLSSVLPWLWRKLIMQWSFLVQVRRARFEMGWMELSLTSPSACYIEMLSRLIVGIFVVAYLLQSSFPAPSIPHSPCYLVSK